MSCFDELIAVGAPRVGNEEGNRAPGQRLIIQKHELAPASLGPSHQGALWRPRRSPRAAHLSAPGAVQVQLDHGSWCCNGAGVNLLQERNGEWLAPCRSLKPRGSGVSIAPA